MAYLSDYTGKEYSKRDFLEMIEKRVRKHLRVEQLIDLRTKYAVIDEGISSKILLYLLDKIFSGRLTVFIAENNDDIRSDEALLSSEYLEEYISKRLEVFFERKDNELLKSIKAPLKIVSAQEINTLAEILEIEGKKVKPASEFIEKLQEKYPQTKTSLLKSFDNITNEIIPK